MLTARGNVVRLVQAPGIDHEHIARRFIENMLGDESEQRFIQFPCTAVSFYLLRKPFSLLGRASLLLNAPAILCGQLDRLNGEKGECRIISTCGI
jgi:hypothetical protein